jgi:hypothetical protein
VTRGTLAGIGAAAALAGCTSVLGLDAPTLDPCAGHTCNDATAEAGVLADASADGAVEAPSDGEGTDGGASDSAACAWDGGVAFDGSGVRCGGGCYATATCAGAAPVCCQTGADAGVLAFACVANEGACSGYPVDCVNENDCSGSEVCCHYSTHTICANSCTSSGATACLPGSADDCPTGWTCRPADAGGSPYYTCQQ